MTHKAHGQVKVDIRVWVLLLDWNPLTIFCNTKPYFRLCNRPYKLDKRSLKDKAARALGGRAFSWLAMAR